MVLAKLRTPMVLVHGLLGYGEMRVGNLMVSEYFPGVSQQLRAAAIACWCPP
jgi:hypothetical protein